LAGDRVSPRPRRLHGGDPLGAAGRRRPPLIDEVAGTHERVVVTKNDSPVAVIPAVEDYE
jgi:prevent-host-death family protein